MVEKDGEVLYDMGSSILANFRTHWEQLTLSVLLAIRLNRLLATNDWRWVRSHWRWV